MSSQKDKILQIEELLIRSIDTIYPSKDALKEKLLAGKKLRVYVGIDPTAEYVHLGHTTNFLILKRFHRLGHKIIILVGDFTALIGDPSDKNAVRKRLTPREVKKNLKTYKNQIGKIFNFGDRKNPIEFRFNSRWLSTLSFQDVVDLASNVTVQQMIERDNFKHRLADKKPLYVHEFLYPLMQGYDSVALDADVEIGGTDQTFNMLVGRTLLKTYKQKEKFVMTTTLLEDSVTGEKLMSKSLGTGIAVNEQPNDMFGKIMALPDRSIIQCFTDCTEVTSSEIREFAEKLTSGTNPREVKLELARRIVSMYHGKKFADKAAENFINIFSNKKFPETIKTYVVQKGERLDSILLAQKIIKSKSEWTRLILGGGISIRFPDEKGEVKITDKYYSMTSPIILQIGKKIFLKIIPNL